MVRGKEAGDELVGFSEVPTLYRWSFNAQRLKGFQCIGCELLLDTVEYTCPAREANVEDSIDAVQPTSGRGGAKRGSPLSVSTDFVRVCFPHLPVLVSHALRSPCHVPVIYT